MQQFLWWWEYKWFVSLLMDSKDTHKVPIRHNQPQLSESWLKDTDKQRTVEMGHIHYNDAIMSMMASQITSLKIDYSTVYSRCRSKKTSRLCVSNAENVSVWWCHHVCKIFWRIIWPTNVFRKIISNNWKNPSSSNQTYQPISSQNYTPKELCWS